MLFFDTFSKKHTLPSPDEALPGRDTPIPTASTHFVNGRPLNGPYPEGTEQALFGLGCFWGAERVFWETPGVYVTAAGYDDPRQAGHPRGCQHRRGPLPAQCR